MKIIAYALLATLGISLQGNAQRPATRVVIEENTGTQCSYCPRGIAGLEAVKDKYGDDAIIIALHRYSRQDPMYLEYYADLGFDIAPVCRINRGVKTDPFFGETEETPLGIIDTMEQEFQTMSCAEVEVYGHWTDNKSSITAESRVTFAENGGRYSLVFTATADGLTGSTSNWLQMNAYSNTSPDSPTVAGTTLTDFCSGGEYGKKYVALTYDDVCIGSSYNKNEKNEVADIVNPEEGETAIRRHTIEMPDRAMLLNAIDYSKVYIIAMLIDLNTGKIINAAKANVTDDSNVFFMNGEDHEKEMIYDLCGLQHNHITSKGIYFLRSKNGLKKIIR